MLVLTDAAAEVVKSVTSTPQAPDEAGLRITSTAPEPDSPSALQVAAVSGPGDSDLVVEVSGARVYLEPHAATYLDDKVLDAEVDDQGMARFAVGVQQSPPL